jgi:hypothetical protein
MVKVDKSAIERRLDRIRSLGCALGSCTTVTSPALAAASTLTLKEPP